MQECQREDEGWCEKVRMKEILRDSERERERIKERVKARL